MKKFQFKLKGLLKLREFKEQKVKTELGTIVSKLEKLRNRKSIVNNEIEEAYNSQQQFVEKNIKGSIVHFFIYFIDGKRKEIKLINKMIEEETVFYDQKIVELREAMGEVKVLENIKKREFREFKREMNKELQKEIEENLMMRRNFEL